MLSGEGDYALLGRLTLADCALVPGLFLIEEFLPSAGLENLIPSHANLAAYWAAIQTNPHAARILVELRRGLEQRREMIRDGSFAKMLAAAKAAAEAEGA